MLILSRKKGEAIQIGTDIEISVTAIQGDQVKIGINAPKNVEVHRKELWLEIQNENTAALKEVSDLSSIMKNTKKD
ncbi:MAG TPA: carbon storage regulator [Bacillus bacterium]|uniref:Translational regulator CsrA n=1 Tax=Siminovitchia fordii TaxID=254759 RepID=A0ABQ4K424_9BACI|nr:carbon storage regulator CsrA [Siminovitchia fordii]GIN19618.1 carbon storage regulator [Siminovitchia fordii]HBZ11474.1 carbon storage regulator [Bacillus sp. (in: firmicutes)]